MNEFSQQYKFVEICPEINIRGQVFEIPVEATARLKTLLAPKTGRAFRSVFVYDDSYAKIAAVSGTVKGYPGASWSDQVVIDLDDNVSVAEAQKVARLLADRLYADFEVDPKSINIAFSGNRGFHISIPQEVIGFAPSKRLGHIMRSFVARLFDVDGLAVGATGDKIFFLAGAGQTTKIDLSIYKVNGLIRVAGSKHDKTGKFKIFLSQDELFSLTTPEIIELSSNQRARPAYNPPKRNSVLEEIWNEIEMEQNKPAERKRTPLPVINGVEIRTDQRMCMQRIMNDVVPEGEGDERAIRLASHFAGLGTPPEIVRSIMLSWNDKMEVPMAPERIESKVGSAVQSKYYYGCDDPILASMCDKRCFKYEESVESTSDAIHIQSVADLSEKFLAVIRDRRGCGFGIEEVDYYCRRILPGEVCIEVACSGVGKTTIMMDQIVKLRKETGRPVLFLQQELHDTAIMERIVRHTSGIDILDIEERHVACELNSDMTPIQAIFNKAIEVYDGVYFCTLDGLSTKRKLELVRFTQKEKGPLGAVFEDYIGRGDERGSNFSEILTRLAIGVKRVAKECDVPYFCAAQAITQEGLNASTELTANSVRDSRQIFINADFVLGFSRPNSGNTSGLTDNRILGQILKNRRGVSGKHFDLIADFARGEIHRSGRVMPMDTADTAKFVAKVN